AACHDGSLCRIAERVDDASTAEHSAEAGRNCIDDVVLLAFEKIGDAAAIETAGPLLLGDCAHDNWGQCTEQRAARAGPDSGIFADSTGERRLVPVAKERRERPCAALGDRLSRSAHHAWQLVERADLLLCSVCEFLRTAGSIGNTGESGQ